MFFDNENYLFKLKFLGKEIIETKFGDVECLKLDHTSKAEEYLKNKKVLIYGYPMIKISCL